MTTAFQMGGVWFRVHSSGAVDRGGQDPLPVWEPWQEAANGPDTLRAMAEQADAVAHYHALAARRMAADASTVREALAWLAGQSAGGEP